MLYVFFNLDVEVKFIQDFVRFKEISTIYVKPSQTLGIPIWKTLACGKIR